MARASSPAFLTGHPVAPPQGYKALAAAMLLAGCSAAPPAPASTARVEAPETTAPAAPFVAVTAPLRRLTNEEYNNTVRDLLGDTSRPADSFPPDEMVGGFENNTIAPVTQALIERYMGAAESLAATASRRLDKLAPCAAGEEPEPCARKFIERFGRLAFRRPLEAKEQEALLSLYADKQKRSDHKQALQLVIEAMLQSPRFLYRLEAASSEGKTRPLDGYELATRLSYYIWASTPDPELLDAAEAGKLSTVEGVEKATRRLLKDPRATAGIRSFHRQWLDLRELDTASKDPQLYPLYSPELKQAMVEETLRFGARVVLEGGDAISELLTSRKTFVNASLARLYGVAAPGADFALVELPKGERAGLLTQASVMAVHASAEQTSPILRGKFVREKLLCQVIPPPPPGAVVAAPKFDPKLTKKQQFAQHQKDMSCAGCHQMMDPIGFGFEHYDALGAWRTVEGAFQVDAVGKLALTDDVDGDFDGAIALAERLSQSQQVRRCVATQWFRAALGRPEQDEDTASLDRAYQTFSHASYDVRELIVAITTSDSFRHTGPEPGNAP